MWNNPLIWSNYDMSPFLVVPTGPHVTSPFITVGETTNPLIRSPLILSNPTGRHGALKLCPSWLFLQRWFPQQLKRCAMKFIWVFPKMVVPPNWMVSDGKSYKSGWSEGTTIFGNIHLVPRSHFITVVTFVNRESYIWPILNDPN